MEAEPFLDAAPPATLVSGELHPLDVVPEAAMEAAAPMTKKAGKKAAKAAKKAKKAVGKKVAPTAASIPSPAEVVEPTVETEPQREPTAEAEPTAETETETETESVVAWVKPTGGVCPETHPVKAKLASRLFHLPGMLAYDRTRADRCYRDAAAAEDEGFTRAKR